MKGTYLVLDPAVEDVSTVDTSVTYKTEIDESHPFAWARLLHVVQNVKDIKKSTEVRYI